MEVLKDRSNGYQDNSDDKSNKRIKELESDVLVLKRLVYALNVELELHNETDNKKQLLKSQNEAGKNILSSELKIIQPILNAFEETKKEKDTLLSSYKRSLDELTNRSKIVIMENDELRHQLRDSIIKAETNYAEWQKLREKFSLIEEHNELLVRQTKLYINRIKDLESSFEKTIRQIEDDKQELIENFESIKSELLLLKGKQSAYSNQNLNKLTSYEKPNEKLVSTLLMEIKKLSNDVNCQHSKELKSLQNRLDFIESKKCDLDIKLITVTSERDHLQGYVTALEAESRKKTTECMKLRDDLQEIKKNEECGKRQIMKCMAFIREFISKHQTANADSENDIVNN